MTASIVHPREVYKSALLSSASGLVFLHNLCRLFAVSSGLREFELAGNEVRHGNQVVGIAIASCLGFGFDLCKAW
ncbi:JAB domain-containing protein [Geoalkalibacter halelectricus]|uniref:JAB domain-containing protein n=1 Tax=Geoalkalibacter halelectricus TaxID=2847045 RepID=UPI0036F2CEC6